jgi:D-xylose transport system substrate-binding protein
MRKRLQSPRHVVAAGSSLRLRRKLNRNVAGGRLMRRSSAAGKVGVILPDSASSPRWENNDRPLLKAAFDQAGIQSDIQNANKDVAKFGTICDSMINNKVNVLMVVNLDSESGAACLKKAQAAGIKTIDYDRLTLSGGASYHVSFDNVQVGKLIGEGLQKCLDVAEEERQRHLYQR